MPRQKIMMSLIKNTECVEFSPKDSGPDRLGGVTVTVKGREGADTKTAVTDSKGVARFQGLNRSSVYEVTLNKDE